MTTTATTRQPDPSAPAPKLSPARKVSAVVIGLWRFVRRFRPHPHVWKETKRETLGSYIDYGSCPQEITTIYRIGIHETCLLTGENRIRQIGSLHPQDSSPNDRDVPTR